MLEGGQQSPSRCRAAGFAQTLTLATWWRGQLCKDNKLTEQKVIFLAIERTHSQCFIFEVLLKNDKLLALVISCKCEIEGRWNFIPIKSTFLFLLTFEAYYEIVRLNYMKNAKCLA